jgi:uncharacterized protein (DUF58 family)
MAFSDVREYMPGDDIRNIDWNVTARFNHPFVKVFEEERELTVILLVDVSASENFGSRSRMKNELVTELCAVLSFSAIQNNDKIGVIFFSDKIEKFIPAKKGKTHILRIIRELIEFKPEHRGTRISEALRFVMQAIRKKSIVFVISDFMDDDFADALKLANRKHDVVALQVYDPLEHELPDAGMIRLRHAETGAIMEIDSSRAQVRKNFRDWNLKREKILEERFAKSGVDWIRLSTDKNYVQQLMMLFKKRGKRV